MIDQVKNDKLSALLKQAMRGLAGTVSLIATTDGSKRSVMTATSAISLSMNPASMLVCINKNNYFHTFIKDSSFFSINILNSTQAGLAQLCSSSAQYGESRFCQGSWSSFENGVPYLTEAQSTVLCKVDEIFSYGSHDIFIGLVTQVIYREDINPLIYVAGDYKKTQNLQLH